MNTGISALAFFAEMHKKVLKQMPQSLTQTAQNLCNLRLNNLLIFFKY